MLPTVNPRYGLDVMPRNDVIAANENAQLDVMPRQMAPAMMQSTSIPQTTTAMQSTATPTQQYGLSGYESAAQQGLSQSQDTLSNALRMLSGVGGEASGLFNQYANTGNQANQLQAAYSGALGNQAQAQAFQNFQESPATQFLREQGTNQTVNAASATGQNVGGNILKELSQFNQGLASQDLSNQINQLNTLSGQGMNAAGSQANIMSSLAGQGANLMSQGAEYQYGTGQNLANTRLNVGQQLSSNIGNTTTGLANLQSQQGTNLSDILGGNASAISNLMSQTGSALGGNQMNLASILANLATGQGSQLAGLQSQIGASNAAGTVGQQQGLMSGISSLAGGISSGLGASAGGASGLSSALTGALGFLSDDRAKEDIKEIGEENGYKKYSWTWREGSGKAGKAFGTLVSHVLAKNPSAIVDMGNGYLGVNYGAIGVTHGNI